MNQIEFFFQYSKREFFWFFQKKIGSPTNWLKMNISARVLQSIYNYHNDSG